MAAVRATTGDAGAHHRGRITGGRITGGRITGRATPGARELAAPGHEVRLMPPSCVKPCVKRGNTDQADAEARLAKRSPGRPCASRRRRASGTAPKHAERIAMRVTSSTTEETYHWLGSWPMMREWVGPRLVHKLKAHGYSIRNRKFESTVEIDRDTFADDKIGLHAPMVAQLGHAAAQHVEEQVFGLLGDGFTEFGHDGQPFFDTDHAVEDAATGARL